MELALLKIFLVKSSVEQAGSRASRVTIRQVMVSLDSVYARRTLMEEPIVASI